MPPNAVVDASVLVSAFLFPASIPGRVVASAENGAYCLKVSTILLEEASRSLRHPKLKTSYRHSDPAVDEWCDWLRTIGQVIPPPLPEIGPVCRDPDDDHVIAAAVAAGADWIVTGDRDLLDLDRYRTIRIITPKYFLEILELQTDSI